MGLSCFVFEILPQDGPRTEDVGNQRTSGP